MKEKIELSESQRVLNDFFDENTEPINEVLIKKDSLEILKEAIEKHTLNELKDLLFVNKNTIQRWLLLKNVPNNYYVDLCIIQNIPVNYDEMSFKEKDQFFTNKETAEHCMDVFKAKLQELGVDEEEYTYIEPSAGDGSFYNLFPKERKIGVDIEPRCEGVIKENFLKWRPENENKNLILGNPPFGLRGNLAMRFMNHASKFCEFVGFILPQLFESTGKGNCMDRIQGMNLIHSEKIKPNFHYPDGVNVDVNVVFQIWSRNFKLENSKQSCSQYIKIYSVSDGGTPGSTRNKEMLNKCDLYLPSTCFENKMAIYTDFEELPMRRGYGIKILKDNKNVYDTLKNTNWVEESFKSTNSALNLRFDIIENALIKKGYKNKEKTEL